MSYCAADTAHEYDTLLQHDLLGLADPFMGMLVSEEETKAANVFTAQSNMTLEAVSVRTIAACSDAAVEVYMLDEASLGSGWRHIGCIGKRTHRRGGVSPRFLG